eukprot:5230856-Pleurochrysis_carterae.AAC.1
MLARDGKGSAYIERESELAMEEKGEREGGSTPLRRQNKTKFEDSGGAREGSEIGSWRQGGQGGEEEPRSKRVGAENGAEQAPARIEGGEIEHSR